MPGHRLKYYVSFTRVSEKEFKSKDSKTKILNFSL